MSSRWPESMPEEAERPRGVVSRAAAAATAGGVAGWALCFLGLGLGGLAVGAALVSALAGLGSADQAERRRDRIGLALALCLLIWPLLYVAVGYVRYLITGESLGQ